MGRQSDWFIANGYKHTYDLGDRIMGLWNGIPFVGSVGNDRLVNLIDGPEITVHLDLPIKYKDTVYNIIIVKHKDVVRLKQS
jgi:hypothetical protein